MSVSCWITLNFSFHGTLLAQRSFPLASNLLKDILSDAAKKCKLFMVIWRISKIPIWMQIHWVLLQSHLNRSLVNTWLKIYDHLVNLGWTVVVLKHHRRWSPTTQTFNILQKFGCPDTIIIISSGLFPCRICQKFLCVPKSQLHLSQHSCTLSVSAVSQTAPFLTPPQSYHSKFL